MVHADLEDAEVGSRAACGRASAARPNDCCRRRPKHGSRPGGESARRIASLVPVLPTEPVMATILAWLRARAARPSWRMASSTSGTTIEPARTLRTPAAFSSDDDGRRGALVEGRRHEIVPVMHVALDGEVEIAGLERAGVDGRAGAPARSRRRCGRRSRRRSRPRSIGARSSLPLRNRRPDLVVVRERQGPVANDLARFMALAGHDQDIARFEAPRRPCGWPAARSPISRAPGAPFRISARIAAGSSERGLSSVTMTTSAFSTAMRPMSGRLPRSRSPPQPKTQIRASRR